MVHQIRNQTFINIISKDKYGEINENDITHAEKSRA